MSKFVNEIILRPRFDIRLNVNPELIKKAFDIEAEEPFLLKRIDEHVYIRFNKKHTNFWTPQLHLEIYSFSEEKSTIHGVFGPNPTLWSFFMFLHFALAMLFISTAIFAYTKQSLGHDITYWLGVKVLLIFIWIGLYIVGRVGKVKGKPQMKQLKHYTDKIFTAIQEKYGT